MANPFEKFIAMTTRYSPENAYALSEAAGLAYAVESEVINIAKTWGFKDVSFIDGKRAEGTSKDTQLFIASNDEYIVISFRGTQPENIKDWITNSKIRMTNGPFGSKVHRGFNIALEGIWDEIVSEINKRQTKGQSLWITGHSLGGALAILCTAYLRDTGFKSSDPQDKPVFGTYTYGCPRVGDKTFEQKLSTDSGSNIFRFVNNNDLVARVPPRNLGYSHVGQFLYFNEDGSNLETDPSYWYRLIESTKGIFEDFDKLGPDNFKDHAIKNYIERTKKHRAKNPFLVKSK